MEKINEQQPVPDVIISDHGLPGFSGMELAEKIWESDASIPFVLVSGQALKAFSDPSETGKKFTFLQKPYSPEDLIRSIATVTSQKGREFTDIPT